MIAICVAMLQLLSAQLNLKTSCLSAGNSFEVFEGGCEASVGLRAAAHAQPSHSFHTLPGGASTS